MGKGLKFKSVSTSPRTGMGYGSRGACPVVCLARGWRRWEGEGWGRVQMLQSVSMSPRTGEREITLLLRERQFSAKNDHVHDTASCRRLCDRCRSAGGSYYTRSIVPHVSSVVYKQKLD